MAPVEARHGDRVPIYISTNLDHEQLMRTMLLALGVPWKPDERGVIDAPTFRTGAGPVSARSQEISREGFGFTPDQVITFRTWGDEHDDGLRDIVRGTLAICQAIPGDAVLLSNGETVLFMRTAGRLCVNSKYWNGDYSFFTPPYELKAFEVL